MTRAGLLRAVAVVAATSAAIAVPYAVSRGRGTDERDPNASSAVSGPLSIEELRTGAPPKSGYLKGSTFIEDGRKTALDVPPGKRPSSVALFDGGLLLVTGDDLDGRTVRLIPSRESQAVTWPIDGDVAVSDNGGLAAFIRPTGVPVVLQGEAATVHELATVPGTNPYNTIDISGTDCAASAALGPCVLTAGSSDLDGDPERGTNTWKVTPGTKPQPADRGIRWATDVAGNGLVAGRTESIMDGDGACAGVADRAGLLLWQTCRDGMVSFAPDATHVLAVNWELYTFGDHELSVLESETGRRVLKLRTARTVGIHQVTWEDSTHLLAVVSSGADPKTDEDDPLEWAILRLGIDGSRELAVGPADGGTDYYRPYFLPVAPR